MASGLTATYLLPYPLQTDAVDVAADAQALAQAVENKLLLKANLASPALTGTPTAPTPNNSDNSTLVATTAFVKNQSYLTTTTATSTYAPIASPTLTGVPAAPTASNGTNTTQIATTAFVQNALATFVTLPSQTGNSGKYLTTNGTTASWNNIAQSDVTGLSAALAALPSTYAPLNFAVSTKTSSYTLVLTDAAGQVEMNSASANNLLIPTDASVNFPVGTAILIVQLGVGQTTIAAVTPGTTTVNATPGLKLRAQYSTATIIKRAANNWIVSGDLTV
jgi:hypothetical protein